MTRTSLFRSATSHFDLTSQRSPLFLFSHLCSVMPQVGEGGILHKTKVKKKRTSPWFGETFIVTVPAAGGMLIVCNHHRRPLFLCTIILIAGVLCEITAGLEWLSMMIHNPPSRSERMTAWHVTVCGAHYVGQVKCFDWDRIGDDDLIGETSVTQPLSGQ